MDRRILLIRTGGTIDAAPYADPSHPPQLVDTLKGEDSLIINEMKQLPHYEQIDYHKWQVNEETQLVKDSKLFTQADLAILAETVNQATQRQILITHGTDAMVTNASQVKALLQDIDKTIIFVGSMVPLSMHQQHHSDAIAILTYALNNILSSDTGIYIAGYNAHTQQLGLFNPDIVTKNRDLSVKRLQFSLAS